MRVAPDSDGYTQMKGYTIRWATYSEGGFKGGVSLLYEDEVNLWQKTAYGEFLVQALARMLLSSEG